MQQMKPIVDAASIGTTLATLAGWLPAVAAFVSIIWGLIRIYETKTIQSWLRRRK
jgi:hypothetical protein